MSLVLANRCKETTTTVGTGTVNLGGAQTGYQTLVAGVGTGNTTFYVIADQGGANWEVGQGTVTSGAPDTLTRTTVLASSNAGGLVNFAAGTKDVFCDLPASFIPTIITKTTNESRQSTTTLTDDSTLAMSLLASSVYEIRLRVYFGTPTTGGFKFDLNYTGTASGMEFVTELLPPGATAWSVIVTDFAWNTSHNTVVSGGNGYLRLTCKIITTTAGTFSFRWAQQTSQASNTSVWQGSSLTYLKVA